MLITFVKDTWLDTATGIHPSYAKGYCVDAAEAFARYQIRLGNAKMGRIDVAREPEVLTDGKGDSAIFEGVREGERRDTEGSDEEGEELNRSLDAG